MLNPEQLSAIEERATEAYETRDPHVINQSDIPALLAHIHEQEALMKEAADLLKGWMPPVLFDNCGPYKGYWTELNEKVEEQAAHILEQDAEMEVIKQAANKRAEWLSKAHDELTQILQQERFEYVAEIARIKANVQHEAKSKTVTIEMPCKENQYTFVLTAPWAESEDAMMENIKGTLELLAGTMESIAKKEAEDITQKLADAVEEIGSLKKQVAEYKPVYDKFHDAEHELWTGELRARIAELDKINSEQEACIEKLGKRGDPHDWKYTLFVNLEGPAWHTVMDAAVVNIVYSDESVVIESAELDARISKISEQNLELTKRITELEAELAKSPRTWEEDHQRRHLESLGLAEEFPQGCDAVQYVGEALLASRARIAELESALAAAMRENERNGPRMHCYDTSKMPGGQP